MVKCCFMLEIIRFKNTCSFGLNTILTIRTLYKNYLKIPINLICSISIITQALTIIC